MKLQSTFALIDIKHGRKSLAKYFEKGGYPVEVIIKGQIDCIWGHDDGTSREFGMDVSSIEVIGDKS